MADELVKATQKWLNNTYSNVSGFGSVPEDGKTGWTTIYGLIRGLQVELGITPLVDNFGSTTAAYYDAQITPKWGEKLSKNVVYLIQGAFWCKGINPGSFDGVYSVVLDNAVKELKYDAGFPDSTGVLDSDWAKALFDMAAFTIVRGGNDKIRSMQQWLNVNYNDYTGIMPCDGIYQRSTNEALIYALQAELGYSPDEATGSYGSGTTNATYSVSEGDSGNYVKIIQYGLLVNGYYQDGVFDGVFSSYMGSEVLSFRKFMILPAYTTIADMTVIKGLLSSAGNTMRPASGADTSTQLTPAMIKTLVDNDVEIIGRYLTGTVGVGAEKRDKNLTVEELQNIFAAGLSVFPIYQDGGWSEDYFSESQGKEDAQLAAQAANNLGIPNLTIIYFAIDVDIQDGDIDGTVIKYFQGINSYLDYNGYQIGVYGTRNVCAKVINSGLAQTAFVSDMSTGYSGNLGFSMPRQWAFDQFIEFTIGSGNGAVGIDNNAVSGKDKGFNYLSEGMETDAITSYNEKVIGQVARAYQYFHTVGLYNNPHLTFYRYNRYGGIAWSIISSPVTDADREVYDEYAEYLRKTEGLYTYLIDPNSGIKIGLDHLFVTLQSQLFFTDNIIGAISDFAGWTGDLLTCWGEVKRAKGNIEQGVYDLVGAKGRGTFSLVDLYQDCDAVNIFAISDEDGDSTALSSLLKYYVKGGCKNRFTQFIKNRFGKSDYILSKTNLVLENDRGIDVVGTSILIFFIEQIVNNKYNKEEEKLHYYPDFLGDEMDIAKGFTNKIIDFLDKEG
ncbi:MAG: glycoside hydrolase domain-containing protein [Lactococcus chungangensis]|mgnify:CR=1 FL=1|jgi:peptidoglycan hydrolase-like protein with peptidoglycan-binding domain